MCITCGCNQPSDSVTIQKIGEEKTHYHLDHHYPHHHEGHVHSHEDHHPVKTIIELEQDILSKNNMLAERNRGYLEAKNVLAINLVSSPGSGKTTLLERTILDLKETIDFFVVEGDQQTSNDADRIFVTGAPVVQVNTGKGCHLDSEMVHKAIKKLQPSDDGILMIENVGNLVCPSLFDLGEGVRVIIMSVTEGDDKPIKYPDMFHSSQLCIINKIDLLPYVQFDVEKAKTYARQVNHHLEFIELSATSEEGMDVWYEWLKAKRLETIKR
jgi:hydrogenase nickel incorporation protein HypB